MASTTAEEGSKVNGLADQLSQTLIPDKNGKEEVEGEEEEDQEEADPSTSSSSKKKKKKKSGAAKRKAKNSKVGLEQTDPPTVGLTKIFLDGCYPVGELQEYDTSKFLDE